MRFIPWILVGVLAYIVWEQNKNTVVSTYQLANSPVGQVALQGVQTANSIQALIKSVSGAV